MLKKIIKSLIVFSLIFAVILPAFPHTAKAAGDKSVEVQFIAAVDNTILTWSFPYSDEYFLNESYEFSPELARASIGLTVSAFRNDGLGLDNQYETYLNGAGFSDISPFGYDQPTSSESLSGVIAQKKIGDFTLIAAVPCGQGYGNEWGGNLTVGDGDIHEGFKQAANILEDKIFEYIDDHRIDGPMKLWLSGFSRASAVSNITAANMIETGRFDDVFAYLFAVPRTTKDPVRYEGIFNICGKSDPVTQIPLQSWGFERYGVDLYTPAEEYDVQYYYLASDAANVYRNLSGNYFYYNPEVNYQLHLIIEFMSELFPDNSDYAAEFQGRVVELMQEKNIENLLPVVAEAADKLDDLDKRDAYSSEILMEYISYIMSQHLREDDKQVEEGRWDPYTGVVLNLMREHTPSVYLAWVFSDLEPDYLYGGSMISRRILFQTDSDIEITLDGELIGAAYRNGEIRDSLYFMDFEKYEDFEEFFEEMRDVCIIRNGTNTTIIMPVDLECSIILHTYDNENMVYYDVLTNPLETRSSSDQFYVALVSAGEYSLEVEPYEEIGRLQTVRGRLAECARIEYDITPTSLMADEMMASDFITVKSLMQILLWFGVAVTVIMIACLVIAIIHFFGKRCREKTYSKWYVIIPHLILIVIFTLMNQFVTVNIYALGITRQVCASLAMLLMFLLALRGTIMNRNPWNVSITAVLLSCTVVNFIFYQKSEVVSSSPRHFVLYSLLSVLMSMFAVSTFFVKKCNGAQIREAGKNFAPVMAAVAAVLGETVFWTEPDDMILRTICKIVTAVFILLYALLCRRRKEWGFIWIFSSLCFGCLADVLITPYWIPGALLFAAQHICMIILFLRRRKMSVKLWVFWAVISAALIAVVLLFGSKFGVYVYGAAAYVPVLTLLIFSSFNMKGWLMTAACMFFISDVLLFIYNGVFDLTLMHIIYMALFYAALLLFAGIRLKNECRHPGHDNNIYFPKTDNYPGII